MRTARRAEGDAERRAARVKDLGRNPREVATGAQSWPRAEENFDPAAQQLIVSLRQECVTPFEWLG